MTELQSLIEARQASMFPIRVTANSEMDIEKAEILEHFANAEPFKKQVIAQTTQTIIAILEAQCALLEEKITEYKTRKRMTPFQDTLFNHAVNVLSEIIASNRELLENLQS